MAVRRQHRQHVDCFWIKWSQCCGGGWGGQHLHLRLQEQRDQEMAGSRQHCQHASRFGTKWSGWCCGGWLGQCVYCRQLQQRGQGTPLCLCGPANCAKSIVNLDRGLNGSSEKCLPGVMKTEEPENQVTLVTQTICLAKKCLDLIVDAFRSEEH